MRTFRLFLIGFPLLLSACSSGEVKDTLGLDRTAPDEFSVVSRPPLSVPPEFELAPPRPGAEGPAATQASDTAHQVLTGKDTPPSSLDSLPTLPASDTAVTPVISSDAPNAAESNFMDKLGADKADADIRDKLATDAMVEHPSKKGDTLYDKVVNSKTAQEPAVDPAKETERIHENKDAGQPPATGDENVPTVEDKPKSVIDELF